MPLHLNPERWRWHAAVIGWLLWTVQWGANSVEGWLLGYDQTVASIASAAQRAAFVVAVLPGAESERLHLVRCLDIAGAALLTGLLAILAWPGLLQGQAGDPQTFYLYAGYGAMVVLCGISLIVQRSRPISALFRALFICFILYGAFAVFIRSAFENGMVSHDGLTYVIGGGPFLGYLILIRSLSFSNSKKNKGEFVDTVVHLVPLVVASMVISLTFALFRITPVVALGAGLAALLIYAGRASLIERERRRKQRAVIERERLRLATMLDMMHDLRSPLGVVMLNSELLLRSPGLRPEDKDSCRAITSGSAKIMQLMEDVLVLERLEAGLLTPDFGRFDLGVLIRDIQRDTAALAKGYCVSLKADPLPLEITSDAAATRRILDNLVSNALRFTPRGGEVALVATERRDARVQVTVEDTGIGISPEARARLFDRFCDVGTPVHGSRGNGLGLSLSRSLARNMGGDVVAAPRPGGGTTMVLILPIAPVAYTRV